MFLTSLHLGDAAENNHLSLGPYKESVTSVQIQMPFHAVGRPSGGSYAPGSSDAISCGMAAWCSVSLSLSILPSPSYYHTPGHQQYQPVFSDFDHN